MLIHRDGWRYSGRAPEFFPGQSGCFCCPAPSTYHIRQFENDSGVALLAQVTDNRVALGLQWTGTELVAVYNQGSSAPFTRAKTYDSALADVRTTTHSYNTDSTASPNNSRSVYLCGDGTYCMIATRTTATNTSAVASVNSDDSLDWETNYGTGFPDTNDGYCVIGDSSGNVYAVTVDTSTGRVRIRKYNASGTLQWTSTTASSISPRLVTIAADGYIWVSGSRKLVRCDTSGTNTELVSISAPNDFLGFLEPDQSNGVWVGLINGSTHEIRNYNSSGSLITTISDAELAGTSAVRFAVDSSDNVYGIVNDGEYKIRKWNSSGTLQWTSGTIGWNASGKAPQAIQVDADYIFVGGSYVT